MGVSLNTAIGIPFLAALPAFLLWSWRSWIIWRTADPSLRHGNYRLAVTMFLVMTTLLVADLGRLRFHIHLGPLDPDPTSVIVLVIRWLWWLTVFWATEILYAPLIRDVIARRTATPPEEPYLGDDVYLAETLRRNERIAYASRWLREVQGDFVAIRKRVDADNETVFMPEERRAERRHA